MSNPQLVSDARHALVRDRSVARRQAASVRRSQAEGQSQRQVSSEIAYNEALEAEVDRIRQQISAEIDAQTEAALEAARLTRRQAPSSAPAPAPVSQDPPIHDLDTEIMKLTPMSHLLDASLDHSQIRALHLATLEEALAEAERARLAEDRRLLRASLSTLRENALWCRQATARATSVLQRRGLARVLSGWLRLVDDARLARDRDRCAQEAEARVQAAVKFAEERQLGRVRVVVRAWAGAARKGGEVRRRTAELRRMDTLIAARVAQAVIQKENTPKPAVLMPQPTKPPSRPNAQPTLPSPPAPARTRARALAPATTAPTSFPTPSTLSRPRSSRPPTQPAAPVLGQRPATTPASLAPPPVDLAARNAAARKARAEEAARARQQAAAAAAAAEEKERKIAALFAPVPSMVNAMLVQADREGHEYRRWVEEQRARKLRALVLQKQIMRGLRSFLATERRSSALAARWAAGTVLRRTLGAWVALVEEKRKETEHEREQKLLEAHESGKKLLMTKVFTIWHNESSQKAIRRTAVANLAQRNLLLRTMRTLRPLAVRSAASRARQESLDAERAAVVGQTVALRRALRGLRAHAQREREERQARERVDAILAKVSGAGAVHGVGADDMAAQLLASIDFSKLI